MSQYCVLHPATFKLDGGAMFGIIPKPLWEGKANPDELNRIPLSLRVLRFETKNKNILIDTGIGDYHGEKFDGQFDVQSQKNPLSNAVKDVTDIILTHLHFDHVGGLGVLNGDSITPVFPNATIHLHKDHYEYALNPTKRDAGSFQVNYFKPLIEYYQSKNQINWLEGNCGEILKDGEDWIKFETSHGHTPHQIHPYDEKLIYMADILPTSNHLSIPWVMGYDIAPGISTEDKERLYNFIQEKDLTVVFEHDPKFWGGRISKNEKGRWCWDKLHESTGQLTQSILP